MSINTIHPTFPLNLPYTPLNYLHSNFPSYTSENSHLLSHQTFWTSISHITTCFSLIFFFMMRNITALVVDDSKVIQKIHQKYLDQLGIQNYAAANGQEAIHMHSSGEHFDIILMDKDMPVMSGVEATRRLREMGKRSVIVGVTTRDSEEEKREFMEAGIDDYQEKPLNREKLCSILKNYNLYSN